jgi:3-phosphoshikimate 1-carboxyvinyltransferase
LIPVAAALGLKARFTGEGRLPERPLGPMTLEMERHGVRFSSHTLPIEMQGQLLPGEYSIAGNISSQYITGLLMALPLLEGDSEIELTTHLESRPYVELTIATLAKYGVKVTTLPNGFAVAGRQEYRSPGSVRAEGDWSNAAFWLCAGALGQKISCRHLDLDSVQGDKHVVELLRQFGANVEINGDTVSVSKGKLRGITIDASEIPDLITAIVTVAAVSEGTTEIVRAGRLRIKESDRILALSEYLRALGCDVTERPEGLLIKGSAKLNGGSIDGQGDHRIVMSAAVASIACESDVVIHGADAVNKSYPEFFEDFEKLGGSFYAIVDR